MVFLFRHSFASPPIGDASCMTLLMFEETWRSEIKVSQPQRAKADIPIVNVKRSGL